MKGEKVTKNIILIIFSIFTICFVIHNKNVINKLFLRNKNINNIILYYDDKNILEFIYENVQNMTYDERMEAYSSAEIKINIKNEYWDKIINAVKKSRYSGTNIEIFFGKMYKIAPPLYNIKIEYFNGKKINISLWDSSFFIDEIWYDVTNKSKEIFVIIDEIIESR
jgi:hypothetical protein